MGSVAVWMEALLTCDGSFPPLPFHSKNENNSHSEVVPYKLEVVVQANVILQG